MTFGLKMAEFATVLATIAPGPGRHLNRGGACLRGCKTYICTFAQLREPNNQVKAARLGVKLLWSRWNLCEEVTFWAKSGRVRNNRALSAV